MNWPVVGLLAFAGLLRGDRVRLGVALAGVTVSIFVVVMHIAFLRGVTLKSTAFYDMFDFDAVVVSRRFQFFYEMPDFPAARLMQAARADGVASVGEVRIAGGDWLAPETARVSRLILFAFRGDMDFVRDPELRDAIPAVSRHGSIAADLMSDADLGPPKMDRKVQFEGKEARIAATYHLGMRMYAEGTGLVSNPDFTYYSGHKPDIISMGLIKFTDPSQAETALRSLASLPADVRVLTRDQLREGERAFFVEVKPLGVLMKAGMWIGLLVGVVALYQALSSHLEARVQAFAVMRAMGHSRALVIMVGSLQLAMLAAVGTLLALLALSPVLGWLARLTTFDLTLGPELSGYTLAVALGLSAVSGALAMWRVRSMDPADLF